MLLASCPSCPIRLLVSLDAPYGTTSNARFRHAGTHTGTLAGTLAGTRAHMHMHLHLTPTQPHLSGLRPSQILVCSPRTPHGAALGWLLHLDTLPAEARLGIMSVCGLMGRCSMCILWRAASVRGLMCLLGPYIRCCCSSVRCASGRAAGGGGCASRFRFMVWYGSS
jgi:hypothetical protein